MPQIYMMTRLYNTNDKIRACELEGFLKAGCAHLDVYMPYRDSDEENIKGDWKQSVFAKDIDEINKSDVVVGYWDGPSFDEGIGFEIGYAISKGKHVVVINDDFLTYSDDADTQRLKIPDPLIAVLGIKVVGSIFSMSSTERYYQDLRRSAEKSYKSAVTAVLECLHTDVSEGLWQRPEKVSKRFIDMGSSILLRKYITNITNGDATTRVSTRFNDIHNHELAICDLEMAMGSDDFFAVNSGSDMTPGSSILCGLRYGYGLPYFIINDRSIFPYSMTGAQMMTNLMVDCGCCNYVLDGMAP